MEIKLVAFGIAKDILNGSQSSISVKDNAKIADFLKSKHPSRNEILYLSSNIQKGISMANMKTVYKLVGAYYM